MGIKKITVNKFCVIDTIPNSELINKIIAYDYDILFCSLWFTSETNDMFEEKAKEYI